MLIEELSKFFYPSKLTFTLFQSETQMNKIAS